MTEIAQTDRPLVTFALFAYNQEKYIREAVEGAFSQTYEPLEIILSDDCSSDRTFEIMQEMAAAYEGPHRVVVRQNVFNFGTALHVQAAFSESSGNLFVVAAGDDISVPSRVDALVIAWAAEDYKEGILHSGRCIFHDSGESRCVGPIKIFVGRELEGISKSHWLPAAAPTCAYTRGVFEKFPPLMGGSIIEDAPLMLRGAIIGRFMAIDQPLVRQRVHERNNGTGYRLSEPRRWNRFMQSKAIAFRNMQEDLCLSPVDIDPVLRENIDRALVSVIRSSANLIIRQSENSGLFAKIATLGRIVFSSAISGSLAERFYFALSFAGFKFHKSFRSAIFRISILGARR